MGLASATTVDRRRPLTKIHPGLFDEGFNRAVQEYDSSDLINVSHDEARTMRTLSAYLTQNNDVICLGEGWNPDIHKWPKLTSLRIPRKDEEKGKFALIAYLVLESLQYKGSFHKSMYTRFAETFEKNYFFTQGMLMTGQQ
jgi:hypothetical protein